MKAIFSLFLALCGLSIFAQDCETVIIQVISGDDPLQMGVALYDEEDELVYELNNSEWEPNFGTSENLCLPDGCYTLDLTDSNGDGWEDGIVYINTSESNFAISVDGNSNALDFSVGNGWCLSTNYYGCTDPEAYNYNPFFDVNDGSCLYFEDCESVVNIELNEDGNADTYTWSLYDDNTNTLIANMPDEVGVFNWFDCLEDGCYRVDLSGEGTNGSVHVELNQIIVGQELFSNDGSESIYFSIGNSPCTNTEGCTDIEALNFDPGAGSDDGSCVYDCEENLIEFGTLTGSSPEEMHWDVYASTGVLVANSSEYNIWHELYTEWYCLEDGCYYVSMSQEDNYSWSGGQLSVATGGNSLMNDSLHLTGPSPAYTAFGINTEDCEAIPGCTQPDAPNFDPEANIDDGSCEDGFGPGGPIAMLTAQETVYYAELAPNPGESRSTLILEGLSQEHETRVSLTTMSGQTVYERRIPAGNSALKEQLDLSRLASGVYLFKVDHAGQSSVERWIKQ